MRALFVSGYKEVPDRGASRAAAGLSAFLRGRGWEVSSCHRKGILGPPPVKPDLLVWSGPTFNQGMVDTIGAARTILWKHGDESLQDYPIEAIATGKAELCVPSLWAGKKLGWDLPFRVLYPAFESAPKLRPLGEKWLHVGAFEPGKGTHEALTAAEKNPGERFLFRNRISRNTSGNSGAGGPSNIEWAGYTSSQEDLWADVKGLLLTSIYETFSMLVYEALLRGLPVWIPDGSNRDVMWSNSSVRWMLNTWCLNHGYHVGGRPWEPSPSDRREVRELMRKVRMTAMAQLDAILEGVDGPTDGPTERERVLWPSERRYRATS